jgi:hypothetical protein
MATAVAKLLSQSTTWRAIEMVLLDCFRQKQTVNKSIYFKKKYGNWTVFVKNKPSNNCRRTARPGEQLKWMFRTVFVKNKQQKI